MSDTMFERPLWYESPSAVVMTNFLFCRFCRHSYHYDLRTVSILNSFSEIILRYNTFKDITRWWIFFIIKKTGSACMVWIVLDCSKWYSKCKNRWTGACTIKFPISTDLFPISIDTDQIKLISNTNQDTNMVHASL